MHHPNERWRKTMDMLSSGFVRMEMNVFFLVVRMAMGMPAFLNKEEEAPDAKDNERDANRQFRIPLECRIKLQMQQEDYGSEEQDGYGMAEGPATSKPRALERIRFKRDEVGDGRDMVLIEGMAHAQDEARQQ